MHPYIRLAEQYKKFYIYAQQAKLHAKGDLVLDIRRKSGSIMGELREKGNEYTGILYGAFTLSVLLPILRQTTVKTQACHP